MTNVQQSTDYQTRLRQLEQQKRDAERAKREHDEILRAPDAAVAEAQAQIDALHRQEQQRQRAALVRRNAEVADAALAAYDALIATLERGDLAQIPERAQMALAAHDQHIRQVDATLTALGIGATPSQRYYFADQQRLKQVHDPHRALLEWIGQSSDAPTRQIRVGLKYAALGGDLLYPAEGYSAAQDYRQRHMAAMYA